MMVQRSKWEDNRLDFVSWTYLDWTK